MSKGRVVFFCGELMTGRGRPSVVGLRRARETDDALWCTGGVGEWKQVKTKAVTKECVCKKRQERKERKKKKKKKEGAGLRRQEDNKAALLNVDVSWEGRKERGVARS